MKLDTLAFKVAELTEDLLSKESVGIIIVLVDNTGQMKLFSKGGGNKDWVEPVLAEALATEKRGKLKGVG